MQILQSAQRLWVGLVWPEEITGVIELSVGSWPPPSPHQYWKGSDSQHHSGNIETDYDAIRELPAWSKRKVSDCEKLLVLSMEEL